MIKTLHLVGKDILNMAIKRKRIFAIIMISLTAISISMFFLLEMMLVGINEFERGFLNKKKVYRINLTNNNPEESNRLLEKLNYNEKDMHISYLESISTIDTDKMAIVVKGVSSVEKKEFINIGDNHEIADFEKIKNSAIVSTNIKCSIDEKDLYSLIGAEFTEIGETNIFNDQIIIPLDFFAKNKLEAERVTIKFASIPDSKTVKRLEDIVTECKPDARIIYPPKINKDAYQVFVLYGFIIFCLIIFAISNIVSLFRFWVSENALQYSIYSLCGAKNTKLYVIILFQAMLLGVFSYILGYLINILALELAVEKISEVYPLQHLPWIYVVSVFFIYTLIIYLGIRKIARYSSNTKNILNTLNNGGKNV